MMCLWESYKKKIWINVAGSYVPIINKLSRWLFSRVLASHARSPSPIPGRDMSVLGPLVKDGDDLGKVSL